MLSKIICYYWNKSKISDVQVKTNTYYNVIRRKTLILAKNKNKLRTKPDVLSFFFFFFYQGFLSKTLTTHRTAREGRGPSSIPLYHFQPLTNIQTFICNFACEMTITYFQSHRLYLPDCYSMRFTNLSNYHLIDWWCDVSLCLFVFVMFDSSFFVTAIWDGKPVDSSSHSTITLVLQANRLTKCASPTCFACCLTEHKSELSSLAILKLIRTKHQNRVYQ